MSHLPGINSQSAHFTVVSFLRLVIARIIDTLATNYAAIRDNADLQTTNAPRLRERHCDSTNRTDHLTAKTTKMEPVRVLQVVTIMNRAGLETMLMNYYRNIDREKIQFDFLVHRAEKGDYDDEIKKLGGRIYRFNPITIKSMPGYKKKMVKLLKNHPEYRVVHSHLDALSALPLAAAKKAKIPLRIAHSHVNGFDIDFKLPMRYFMKTLISSQATHLAACSKEAGRFMFGNYREVIIIKNAIDAKKFEFDKNTRDNIRKELGIKNDFVVGHVGRFNKPKNHKFIIKLFAELNNKIPDSKLVLVGTGETQGDIRKLARRLKIEGDVLFLGLRNDVPDVMQAMDVFVLPSLYEGLGIVAIEAQASGLHCVISERVSREVQLSNLCKTLYLETGHANWADYIASITLSDNQRASVDIGDYDVIAAHKSLQRFYVTGLGEKL